LIDCLYGHINWSCLSWYCCHTWEIYSVLSSILFLAAVPRLFLTSAL
jgi:hypothetical protein